MQYFLSINVIGSNLEMSHLKKVCAANMLGSTVKNKRVAKFLCIGSLCSLGFISRVSFIFRAN